MLCRTCKNDLELEHFYFRKDSGKYRTECKKCTNELATKVYHKDRDKYRERHAKYREENKEKIAAIGRIYQKENADKIREYRRKWLTAEKRQKYSLAHERKIGRANLREKQRSAWKRRYQENPEKYKSKQRAHQRKRRADPAQRMKDALRTRLCAAIRRFRTGRKVSGVRHLGCSFEEFVKYIESLWLPGMSWENYGNTETSWSIDHIRPVSSFDMNSEEEQALCVHYTNLQPLWHIDNIRKSNTYVEPEEVHPVTMQD
jgi:hypothetical protein